MNIIIAGSPEERIAAAQQSIAHWQRMIEWARRAGDWRSSVSAAPSAEDMRKSHNESWVADSCALCKLCTSNCGRCPLNWTVGRSCDSGSAYAMVCKAKTWPDWVQLATTRMLPELEATLAWVKGYNAGEKARGLGRPPHTTHTERQTAIMASIAHWDRMIAYVKTLPDPGGGA